MKGNLQVFLGVPLRVTPLKIPTKLHMSHYLTRAEVIIAVCILTLGPHRVLFLKNLWLALPLSWVKTSLEIYSFGVIAGKEIHRVRCPCVLSFKRVCFGHPYYVAVLYLVLRDHTSDTQALTSYQRFWSEPFPLSWTSLTFNS